MDLGGVIVTDGNERATLAVTRSLGRRGIPVFVGAETPSSLAGSSCFCTQSFTYPSPWRDPEAYVSCIIEVASRWGAKALFPMTDIAMELIGENRHEIERLIALPIPSLEQYHLLSDKSRLTAWAQSEAIPVPPTIFVNDHLIEDAIAQLETWPVVVKPGRSLLKVDGIWRKSAVLIAQNADEVRRLYHEAWFLQQPSMIQQFITGHGEGVFGLFEDGSPTRLFAHRRLRERPPSGGVSVLRESIALPEPMTEYAVRIMREAKWNGIAMVEFKVGLGSRIPYLMEVNGRFWGSLQLAVDAGVDFPMMLFRRSTAGAEPAAPEPYQIGTRLQWWLGDLDHLLARLRSGSTEDSLPPGTSSRWKTVLDLTDIFDLRTKNEVWRAIDRSPGIFELRLYFRSAFKSIFRKINHKIRSLFKAISYDMSDVLLRIGLNIDKLGTSVPKSAKYILIICKGNICRSPFVDRFLIDAAKTRRLNLEISSAGLEAESGRTAYPMARAVSRKFGVELDDHRTTAVSQALVDHADIILVMEPDQRRQLVQRFPNAQRKTFLLGHFSRRRPSTEIADPYGGDADEFERCYTVLTDACEGFLSRL